MLLRFDGEWPPFADDGRDRTKWDVSPWWDRPDTHGNYPTAYLPSGGLLRWLTWTSAVKTPGVHEVIIGLAASVGKNPPEYVFMTHHQHVRDPSVRGPFHAHYGDGYPLDAGTCLWVYINGYGPRPQSLFGGAPVEVQATAWVDGAGVVPHWHGAAAAARPRAGRTTRPQGRRDHVLAE